MMKIIASFDCEVNGKTGKFIMDYDTPICTGRNMAYEFLKYLDQIEENFRVNSKEEAKDVE